MACLQVVRYHSWLSASLGAIWSCIGQQQASEWLVASRTAGRTLFRFGVLGAICTIVGQRFVPFVCVDCNSHASGMAVMHCGRAHVAACIFALPTHMFLATSRRIITNGGLAALVNLNSVEKPREPIGALPLPTKPYSDHPD